MVLVQEPRWEVGSEGTLGLQLLLLIQVARVGTQGQPHKYPHLVR